MSQGPPRDAHGDKLFHAQQQQPHPDLALSSLREGDSSPTTASQPRDPLPDRYSPQLQRFTDLRNTQRKPTPSPLQSSQTTTSAHTDNGQTSPGSTQEHSLSSRAAGSLRSPFQNSSGEEDHPRSPKERLDGLLATETSIYGTAESGTGSHSLDFAGGRKGSLGSPKITSYGQLRNASLPLPITQPPRGSPPLSSSMNGNSFGTQRPDPHPMPRTSSIDSAISSISSTTSHSYKSSQDSAPPNSADISNLISTAGSPEAVIQHLLKEKQHSAAQNAQLWRLVDKQRSLVIGLNKDLERALKDKDRYRKKLKDHLAQVPRMPGTASQPAQEPARTNSESPAPSEALDELPIQNNLREMTSGPMIGMNDILETYPEARASNLALDPLTSTTVAHPPTANPHPRDLSDLSDAKPKSLDSGCDVASSPIGPRDESNTAGSEHAGRTQTSPLLDSKISPTSFTAKRSLPILQKFAGNPSVAVTEPSPQLEQGHKSMPPPRKPPPAPLDLNQLNRPSPHLHHISAEDHSGSEYDDILEVDEIPAFERGRRKTREEDDREREAAALKALESRSASKKSKSAKRSVDKPKPDPVDHGQVAGEGRAPQPPKHMVPQSPPASTAGLLSPPTSLAAALSVPSSEASLSLQQRILSAPPMSPGLPVSPRPGDRPFNSPLPRMPREGTNLSLASPPQSPYGAFPGLPSSPRAPKQPIPYPPNTPVSITSPEPPKNEAYRPSSPATSMHSGEGRAQSTIEPSEQRNISAPRSSSALAATHICRDLVSDEHPDLLLPPNALPSIEVKICSSRLRPIRNSYLASKNPEEGAVFTLGVYSRASGKELWRAEKILMALPQLDHQLKQCSQFNARLPDRALFTGHAPARIDARRKAMDRYFEQMLNTPLTDIAALVVCRFLSTDAVEPQSEETSVVGGPVQHSIAATSVAGGRTTKEGYLTKRGKNFGGWKARYFVLDGPIFRYYESPGGPHLGTIKLQAAQIGKQSQQPSHQSPSRAGDDIDNQYRHAFLILEPKRKDSSSLVRHVLCAESDLERDEWVEALLQYVDYQSSEDEQKRPAGPRNGSGSSKKSSVQSKVLGRKDSGNASSPDLENNNALQALSYEDTVAADAPQLGSTVNGRHLDTPSPPPTSAHLNHQSLGPSDAQSVKSISGPTNGGPIQDAGAWGNKPLAANRVKDKEHKKRSFWGFKARSSTDLALQAQTDSMGVNWSSQPAVDRTGNVRAVFGAPLADAVENCSPTDIDVHLPAVVYRCIEYLDAKDAASEEGIFRLSGSNVLIKALRERFNVQGDVDFLAEDHYYDIHAVASLLKLYLRELPTTVLTRELHLDFISVLELDDREKKVAAYKELVLKLPQANWSLLRALSAFLISIVNNSEVNKMTVRNVGIVFSPTLNIPAPVFSMFLTDFDDIFGSEYEGSPTTAVQISVTESLTPEDIRSPRHQMFSELPTPSFKQETFPPHDRTYEQILHESRAIYDTGFTPLQPSYDQQPQIQNPFTPTKEGTVTVAGPEYGSINGTLAPGGARDTKSRRRESSMLLTGIGQRKSSMPKLTEDKDTIGEEEEAQPI